MKVTTTVLALTFLVMLSVNASAGTPGVNARQHNQQHRIFHGMANGSLTARETVRLGAQQWRIQQHENRIKSDGRVTYGERVRLHRHQNAASHNIYRQKHDGQFRH